MPELSASIHYTLNTLPLPLPYTTSTSSTSSHLNPETSPMMEEPQTAAQSQSSHHLPPLLALPLELTLEILSNFADTDEHSHDDVDNKLALMLLRHTHSSFRRIIPKQKPTFDLFLEAENRRHFDLFAWICGPNCRDGRPHHIEDCKDPCSKMPCYQCFQFWTPYNFGYDESDVMKLCKRSKESWGLELGYRWCDYCSEHGT